MHPHEVSHQRVVQLFKNSAVGNEYLFGIRKTIGLETIGFTFYRARLDYVTEDVHSIGGLHYVFRLSEVFYVGESDVCHFPSLTQYTFSTICGHSNLRHIPAFDLTPFIIPLTSDILSLLNFFLPALQAKFKHLYKTKADFETIKKLLPQLELKKDG